MRKLSFAATIAVILFSVFNAATARPVKYYPGIYSLGATDAYIAASIYDSDYVAGGAVRVSWPNLEPSEGSYNWAFLDHEIATAKSRGKRISVFLVGAFKSPAWIASDPNIHFFSFRDASQVVRLPLPYDSVYFAKFSAFITAFGAHYKDDTTIAYIRGASESVTNGWGLPGYDTAGRTLAGYYHYTTDTLLHAMEKLVDVYMAAFPYTPEWVEVGKLPFDTLGGHHNIYIGEQIAAYGFAKYPDRFNVWREDFNACFPVPPDTFAMPNPYSNSYWHILYEHPCRNGAQAVWNVRDVSCTTVPRMDQCDPAQCSRDTVLWRAVQRTLRYSMTYLEVYAADVADLSLHSTLQRTADSLAAHGRICFGANLAVAAVALPGARSWRMFPNPATSVLNVQVNSPEKEEVRLELRDVAGRLIRSLAFSTNGSEILTLSLQDPGLYLVTMKRPGRIAETRQLCVVK